MTSIVLDDTVQLENIYFVPLFIKCVHCKHEIPIGTVLSSGGLNKIIVDNGGCGKTSYLYEYGKYFGVIKNVT